MTNKLREALEKIAEGDQIEVDCIMRGEWEALCDYQREIAKSALNEPQVDWKEKFEKEQQACNHWFKEANKSHNEACKIADEFRELKEKHQQLLHYINNYYTTSTTSLRTISWIGSSPTVQRYETGLIPTCQKSNEFRG